jgi:site-specific DNA recombinase
VEIVAFEHGPTCTAKEAKTKKEQLIKRVAAYCRVSTLLEEQEESYETQCSYYRRLIEADPGLQLVDVYGDHGISGLSAKARPEFQRMMQDCMDRKIDLVMTKSVSRFARNLADCVESVRRLKEKGIPVLFEREGLNSLDPGSEMLLTVLATLAQEEINSLSQNIRWAHDRLNASGSPATRARYGYRKVRTDKGKSEWRIDPQEAKRVRKAFQMAEKGKRIREIIGALNAMERAEGTHMSWSRARVRSMLLSETYIGDILTNKRVTPDYLSKRTVKNTGQCPQYYIEGHHPAIVDRTVFETAGQMLRDGLLRSNKKRK